MEAQAVKSTHPILIIAGIAVTVFSLVGVAAIMGWVPTSKGQTEPAAAMTAPAPTPAPVAQAPETPAPPAPAPRAEKHVAKKPAPRHEQVARAEPQPQAAAVPPPPPVVAAICRECGVIDGIHEIDQAGKGSGGGAIAGGILGGVVGHQTGNGRGRDLMTVLGAVGGAVAGNAVEKRATESKSYEILVRFEDGNTRIIKSATPPAFRVGDKVKVINGVIQSNG
jgi:outer membrane lipoprotein SlyB